MMIINKIKYNIYIYIWLNILENVVNELVVKRDTVKRDTVRKDIVSVDTVSVDIVKRDKREAPRKCRRQSDF